MYLQAIQLWENRQVQQAPGFIRSLLLQLVIEKTSSLLIMTVLKSFLPQIACRTKKTFLTSPLADLDLNWYCGVSTSDGRFPESQNISINRYVTNKIYCATFPAACYQEKPGRQTSGMLGCSAVHFSRAVKVSLQDILHYPVWRNHNYTTQSWRNVSCS